MTVPTNTGATGSYQFAPSAGHLVQYAFSLINIRPTELTTQHYIDAGMAANFAMVDLSNRNPLRFALETQSIPLVQGTATYALAARTIAVSIVTIATTYGGVTTERTIGAISAYEYQAQPQKSQQAAPTSYFFSLLESPTLTFWPTPDGAQTYTANVQSFRQVQDVDLTNAQGLDSPYRFLDALSTGIAARLAESYQPQKAPGLYMLYEQRLKLALARDEEFTPISLAPGLASYYRL